MMFRLKYRPAPMVLLLALSLIFCTGTGGLGSVVDNDSIRIRVEFDKELHYVGEPIYFSVTVLNLTTRTLKVFHPAALEMPYEVELLDKSGRGVARTVESLGSAQLVDVSPRESLFVWHDLSGFFGNPPTPESYILNVSEGDYRLVVRESTSNLQLSARVTIKGPPDPIDKQLALLVEIGANMNRSNIALAAKLIDEFLRLYPSSPYKPLGWRLRADVYRFLEMWDDNEVIVSCDSLIAQFPDYPGCKQCLRLILWRVQRAEGEQRLRQLSKSGATRRIRQAAEELTRTKYLDFVDESRARERR